MHSLESGLVGVQAEISGIDDRPVWAGAGAARLAPHEALMRASRFRIGSTTKAFVATVALQLVEEGALSLDDTVERWLPDLLRDTGQDAGHITLRQLLQQTSGLPDYVADHEAMMMAVSTVEELRALLLRPWTPAELVALGVAHEPEFPPGARWSYSNTGYVVIGMMIERVTGQAWDRAVTQRIIEPLDLADTYAPGLDPSIAGPHADGYMDLHLQDQSDPVNVTELNPTVLDAEGALISTTADLDRFFRALLGGELLGPDLLAEMKTTMPIDQGPPGTEYGLGLVRFPLACGGAYWNHPGDVYGYHVRGGVTESGDRSATVAATGDGDVDAGSDALIVSALCP